MPGLPTFAGQQPEPPDRARVVIVSAPYEGTVSYGRGAAAGPAAIIAASRYLELYDEELGRDGSACGILTAPALALAGLAPAKAAELVEREIARWLAAGKFPVLLGGEHSVSLGAIRAAHARHPQVGVLQLDAHADSRTSYHGEPYSHACVMGWARQTVERSAAVGIRSLGLEEAARLQQPDHRVFFAHEYPDLAQVTESVLAALPAEVYLTIDVDFFAPHVIPATGTPEPGGYEWYPTLDLLRAVFSRKRVVGFDVVELAPLPGLAYPDFTVAKLVYRMIGWLGLKRAA